jgi:hypothetical protein
MFNTRKHLSRRTLLKGAGVSIALPLLDAMIPASTALAQTAAKPVPRLGFVYFAHGALQDEWQPKQVGRDFELPFISKPLDPFREHLTIISRAAQQSRRRRHAARLHRRNVVVRRPAAQSKCR